ncbi:hypothetical protein RJP21_04690 [Paenibacillus sp. VCA1]|uniref:hypothetical protein n=1 Tax=Paenibacillus sp. VCA1 TaxID=3039148 RepID=UPI002870E1BA|nr:hypothetical protein [Paenibacillus sp. VCA1]MDR9852898.1 hypothetical protein [Paenibacillus sp. VCA1]
MAVFQSKYRELSFYVAGERYSFSSGTFSTDDAEVIAVLDTMADAKRIDEPKKTEEPKEPDEPKAVPKPRKSSGK